MADSEYWVEISQAGVRLGAGFLLTNRFVITALHCLRGIASGDDTVDLSFPPGETISGRVCDRVHSADLALIEISKPAACLTVPIPDRDGSAIAWRTPYRPSIADPYLSGGIMHSSVRYQCESGGTIEALQLCCGASIGDYSGYSGGPVERDINDGSPVVLGILMEQYPDRQESNRASNVLFAATMAEVLRRFGYFNLGHWLNVPRSSIEAATNAPAETHQRKELAEMTPLHRESSLRTTAAEPLMSARYLLIALRELAEDGLLDQAHISILQLRIVTRAVDRVLGDSADE